ncbi:right-handed parallel beta-helix repeat-containing protein [Negadavirga shengliensis]|uniref:Right-handed parallel beta-helix repeat-containing protein n=1 Tax=Negadavirga shengliensis TaxID=1389218 RepID=A0ABV9T094_9BACT
MKKCLLSFFVFVTCHVNLLGQVDTVEISGYDSLFAPVIQYSHTGILPYLHQSETPIGVFDGESSEMYPLETHEFRQILVDLEMSNLGGQYQMIDSIMPAFQKKIQEQREVPFVFLHLEYDELREDSLLMEYDEELKQLFILDPQGESPFATNELFIVSIPDSFYGNGLRYVIDSSHYYTNTSEKPTSFEISFNEGNTWEPFDWGDTLTNAQSLNSIFYIKALFPGNVVRKSMMSASNTLHCGYGAYIPEPALAPWNPLPSQFFHGNVIADYTQNPGGAAIGNAYTWFRPNPAQGEENLYKKPVIIVEGLELGIYDEQDAGNYQMGTFGWCGLWGNGDYPLENMPDLLYDLHDNGYDIIMLDFKYNRRDIRENAYVLVKLIEKINEYKTTDAEPNVVIGASMGGLISRYALRWMENNNMDHCTRLYLSIDAPHRGAYISVGALHMISHLAVNTVKGDADARDFLNKLKDKAVMQMLRHNIIFQSDQEFDSFYGELQALGYPQKTKNVAIASGSKQGNTFGFNSGDRLFFAAGSWNIPFLWRQMMEMEYYALPGKSGNVVYEGVIAAGVRIGVLFPIFAGPKDPRTVVFNKPDQTSFDRLAGGYRTTAEQLGEQIGAKEWIQTHVDHDRHCFVPLVSALDLNTSNWYYDASGMEDDYPDPNLTPFDAIYAPSDNTEHVEITDGNQTGKGDNIEFALRHIKEGGSLPNVGNVITSTYNYGSSTKTHITHERVENGGKMLLYGNQADGDGGGPTPPTGNTHNYFLGHGSCFGKDLNIGNNGELVVGESSVGNKAELYIQESSALILESGGKMIVKNGSKVIIEDGGNFAFLDGAEIILEGSNSILEIKGKVTVGDDATFTFSGGGRMIIDQFIWGSVADNFWDIGQNAKMHLEGSTPFDQVLLECKGNFSPKMQNHHTFAEITIKTGKALLHPGVHMSITSPLTFRNMEVTVPPGMESSDLNRHGGLRLWGNHNDNTMIYNNRFYHGIYGINASQVSATHPLKIDNSTFENCGTGIKISGKSYEIMGCDFENNIEGVYTSGIHSASFVKNSTFKNNQHGLFLYGQSGTEVTVEGSDFLITTHIGLPTYGIWLEDHNLTLRCNTFNGLHYGVYATDDYQNPTVFVDMKDDAHNDFTGNTVGVILMYVAGFSVVNGQNNFYNDKDIHYLGLSTYVDMYDQTRVDMQGNTMEYCSPCYTFTLPWHNGGFKNEINFTNGGGAYTYNPDHAQSFVGCSQGMSNPHFIAEHTMIGMLSSEINVDPDLGENLINLIDASLDIAEKITTPNNLEGTDDELAFEQANNVTGELLPMFSQLTNEEKGLLHIYIKMKQKALAQMYAQEILAFDHAAGNDPHDEVEQLNGYIQSLINAYGTPTDTAGFERRALFNLERAHAYRQGGFYPEAMAILTEFPTNVSARVYEKWSYWDCICSVENDYLTEAIEQEQFDQTMSYCNTQFAPSISPDIPETDYESQERKKAFILNIYPNPTGDFLYFRTEHLAEPEEIIRKEMFNLLGVKVYSEEIEASYMQRVDVRNLPSGSYILEVTGGGKTYQKKVIVN